MGIFCVQSVIIQSIDTKEEIIKMELIHCVSHSKDYHQIIVQFSRPLYANRERQ